MRTEAKYSVLFFTVTLCLLLIPISKSSVSLRIHDSETIIDPEQYPGSTNFEKLQNALNAVPQSGATVTVPAKVYQGSSLIVPSNVRIVGADGTIFKLSDDAISPFMIIEDRTNVSIETITFDGNMENINDSRASMIFICPGCENIMILNNTFKNFRNQAITSEFPEPASPTRFVSIYRNAFYNGAGAAILLRGSYLNGTFFMEDVQISENTLYNLTVNGKIGVAFINNPSITNNNVTSCEAKNSGTIAIRGCKDAYVARNSITGSVAKAGVFIETSMNFPNTGEFIIENNRITGQRGDGFSLSGDAGIDAEITLRKNFFTQNSGTDIKTTEVKAFVYANTVDTPDDLVLSSTTVAWGNVARFCTGYTFIQSRAR